MDMSLEGTLVALDWKRGLLRPRALAGTGAGILSLSLSGGPGATQITWCCWANVGPMLSTLLGQRWEHNVGAMSNCTVGLRWPNVLGQRWANVVYRITTVGPSLRQRWQIYFNVGPSLGQRCQIYFMCWAIIGPTLGQCFLWHNYSRAIIGPTLFIAHNYGRAIIGPTLNN